MCCIVWLVPCEEGSNGTTAVVEAKLKINRKRNLSQVMKTCIVASFIENNLYPRLNSMVPAICVDTERAMVEL